MALFLFTGLTSTSLGRAGLLCFDDSCGCSGAWKLMGLPASVDLCEKVEDCLPSSKLVVELATLDELAKLSMDGCLLMELRSLIALRELSVDVDLLDAFFTAGLDSFAGLAGRWSLMDVTLAALGPCIFDWSGSTGWQTPWSTFKPPKTLVISGSEDSGVPSSLPSNSTGICSMSPKQMPSLAPTTGSGTIPTGVPPSEEHP
mmetsp:Transcript_44797/g.81109  ORF Transcript_44797/g.81109 Transcript_44797/m.81109 type:complete len:202 (+) Transcript_44797:1058-1663(+)